MTIACAAPDAGLGVALRLSTYADCVARALGENGFQALVGGPMMASLLSALVTIFIALIGYRLILGERLTLGDGVGWAVRLGMVLTLITAWPAFQTLVYDVVTDGPGEIAEVLLPASGLPSTGLDGRVQSAYDTMRLGVTPAAAADAASQGQQEPSNSSTTTTPLPAPRPPSPSGQLPQTASLFVVSTTGIMAAWRIAVGFLLAVAPLAILALLFDATLGLFAGWVRALAGAALALVAATIVTAIGLMLVESELATLQVYGQGSISEAIDLQALPTLVLLVAVAMLVTVFAATRMAGAFLLRPFGRRVSYPQGTTRQGGGTSIFAGTTPAVAGQWTVLSGRSRAAAVADALSLSIAREQQASEGVGSPGGPRTRRMLTGADPRQDLAYAAPAPSSRAARGLGRRTRSAAARDRLS